MLKRFLLAAALVASFGTQSAFSAIISQWTFETSAPTTAGPHAAEAGAYAASSFASTNSGGTISTPAGNGSARSFSSNGWGLGEFYQFSSNTVGFDTVTVSFAQAASGTGPRDFQFQYSTDGVNFTVLGGTYVGPTTDFNGGIANPANVLSFDLSSITGLNNSANAVFRVAVASTTSENGGVVAAGGTFRLDDFTINGNAISAVPEPTSMALLTVAGCTGLIAGYRRRKANKTAA